MAGDDQAAVGPTVSASDRRTVAWLARHPNQLRSERVAFEAFGD